MYPIKTVVKMTGIPAVTIRAWESRYGVVVPGRTEGGHRVYTKQDIEDLIWLKEQTEGSGISISQAAQLLKAGKGTAASVHGDEERETGLIPEPVTYKGLIDSLHGALCAFQQQKARSLLEFCFEHLHYEDVFHHVLTPLLWRIGDEWENGALSVAQEHFASEIVMQRFFYFIRVLPVFRHRPKMIALCPAGEQHQVGLLLFTLFLRKQGAEVIYLGPNTPVDGVSGLIAEHGVGLVAMSVTNPDLLPYCEQMIAQLENDHPGLRFVLGGRALNETAHPLERFCIGSRKEDWESWYVRVFPEK